MSCQGNDEYSQKAQLCNNIFIYLLPSVKTHELNKDDDEDDQ